MSCRRSVVVAGTTSVCGVAGYRGLEAAVFDRVRARESTVVTGVEARESAVIPGGGGRESTVVAGAGARVPTVASAGARESTVVARVPAASGRGRHRREQGEQDGEERGQNADSDRFPLLHSPVVSCSLVCDAATQSRYARHTGSIEFPISNVSNRGPARV